MQDDGGEQEALRRRLYRPDASDADLVAYAAVVTTEDHAPDEVRVSAPSATPAAEPPVRRRRWLPLVAVLGAVALAAAAGAGLAANRRAPSAEATAAAVPTVLATRDPGDSVGVRTLVADSGARAHAAGAAAQAAPGRYRYTVAAGDTVPAVAARFGLCTGDVLRSLPYGFDQESLPGGAQLLLGREAGAPTTC